MAKPDLTAIRSRMFAMLLASVVPAGSGCTICCAPFDYHYGAYGGSWERDNMTCGRVGSAFAPAGHPTVGQIVSRPLEPTPLDKEKPQIEPTEPKSPKEVSPTEPPVRDFTSAE